MYRTDHKGERAAAFRELRRSLNGASSELLKTAGTSSIMRFLVLACIVFSNALAVSLPATALTCEVVRALSKAEQEHWSKRLALTSAQRHQIWLQCYQTPAVQRAAVPTR
jgi:hypothetical protein